ncbi:hypothetical protein [uncultured Imperialibacter sp.]|uniref:hypothetical protein n=1 Tax=uncultured Imperialibacter sp. TaxID=1672639 RepID=UPI0030D6DBC8|tara:strand:- start:51433 stop:51786 length:354 start_codon:yes stop_codon:yes gene_type:complete
MTTDNDKFKQLLAKKDLPVLDDNFEEMVMDQILKEELRSSIAGQYVRKMYVFFGAGFVLGLVAMFSISNVVFSWGEWEVTIPPVVLQVPFVLLLLFLIDRIYKARRLSRGEMDVLDD